jgi:hypothetical protein
MSPGPAGGKTVYGPSTDVRITVASVTGTRRAMLSFDAPVLTAFLPANGPATAWPHWTSAGCGRAAARRGSSMTDGRTGRLRVQHYFDYKSPYAWLAQLANDQLEREFGLEPGTLTKESPERIESVSRQAAEDEQSPADIAEDETENADA